MTRATRMQRLQFAVEMAAVRVATVLTAPLSDAALISLAGRIGRLIGRYVPAARKRVEANLKLVRPDLTAAERAEIAAEAGASMCMWGAEYMRLASLAADPSLRHVEGGEHVRAAREAGRPILFVTAHFGGWEFVRLAARDLGVETGILYRAFNNPDFDAHAQTLIKAAGEPVMHKGRQGSRALLRLIGKGGAAMILVDQRQTGAPLAPFLGRSAETSTAVAELAKRSGAALIPACAVRVQPGAEYHVRFEAPVEVGDPLAAMAEVNARIGAWVEGRPGQWFWMHRRWRLSAGVTAPEDA
ncbi:lysophospholipid acyltransferase family protein [Rhodovulum sp. DZ06]|uniref:lysophospholipid acyltransferase family protein n=1 Tax=Rhodovulum sp. DZ06 TaxID=3425126 RepID=UPI003D336A95